MPHDINGFKIVVGHRIQSVSDLKDMFKKALASGFEGLMLKKADSVYKFKRTKDWLKVKPFKSEEFKCVGMEEGTGKNKGRLGAIIINFKGHKVRVGSGFNDKQRDYFWKNKNKIINKCVEVKFFAKTSQSLRFPRFVKIREDKSSC